MKVHYINILLFALPLNILVGSPHKKPSITPHTQTNRLLCECELYAPTNYDNDPEMKAVMQDFDRQTSERFHEYDERMKTTRQKCKDKCEKDIQKIILKDKMEKQMAQQLTTLETKIDTNDIPTCICEKSVADKVEKTCLKCAGVLGGGVAPGWGFLSGIVYTGWKAAALAAAKELAEKSGAAKGLAAGAQAGIKALLNRLNTDFGLSTLSGKALGSFFDAKNYNDFSFIMESIYSQYMEKCITSSSSDDILCFFGYRSGSSKVDAAFAYKSIGAKVKSIVTQAEGVAEATKTQVTSETTAELTAQKTGVVQTTYMGYQTTIIASIVAILVIVLVMVIIYLILRYRRKKKMKKKLQYIKLLEE
ncbi:rifin [Plasmodium falciparum RAJ116]|uniref:Rifin n=1 Tax=Plasmodium falciparum RAJ116 TaxID=580058 RepID=A0A0L0CRV1_PLAFA|nr:rifin [Plasmodium falciparum RAJ116]